MVRFLFGAMLLLVAACTGGPPSSRIQAETGPDGRPSRFVIVGRDSTLYQIARQHNVPIRGLVEANELRPPYRLKFGQRLVLPDVDRHKVGPGETLWRISQLYGVDVNALARENDIPPPYVLRAGETLRIPTDAGRESAAVVASLPPPSTPPRGVVGAEALAPVQPQARPDAPAGEPLPPLPPRKPLVAGSPRTAETATPPATARAPAQVAPVDEAAAAVAAATARPVTLPPVPPRDPGHFSWPTRGRLIARFGPQDGGLHNDGINLAVSRGAEVQAAQTGVVVYAGNELRGFGNLVLIKHDGGWITAYAHNDRLLVERGAVVRRGQAIALAGTTGNVSNPQVHFEVRKDGRPVDPLRVLAPAG
ncbi:MAG: LysM peptidoglycan-binding domain-containing M23 family metallopeptidase [Acetobacterales bacterium]